MIIETGTRPISGDFIAGRLCLDFANTIHNFGAEDPEDDLVDYDFLLDWSHSAGVISLAEKRLLLRESESNPAKRAKTFNVVKSTRDMISRIYQSIAQGVSVGKEDLAMLGSELNTVQGHLGLVQSEEGFLWKWVDDGKNLERVVWPLIKSAADLLMSDDLRKVRRCEGANCNWLFIDVSKNHSRRWCDMKGCGNRAKASRHYHRLKSDK